MKIKKKYIIIPAILSMFWSLSPIAMAEDEVVTFGGEFENNSEPVQDTPKVENDPVVEKNVENENEPVEVVEQPKNEENLKDDPVENKQIENTPKIEDTQPEIPLKNDNKVELNNQEAIKNDEVAKNEDTVIKDEEKPIEKLNDENNTEKIDNDNNYDIGERINFNQNMPNINEEIKSDEKPLDKNFYGVSDTTEVDLKVDKIEKINENPAVDQKNEIIEKMKNPKLDNTTEDKKENYNNINGQNRYFKKSPNYDNNSDKEQIIQPARFVKLLSDDTYDYYLDLKAVRWVNIPYSTSEYMADVWIRMLEKNPTTDQNMPSDLYNYINEVDDEISDAATKGIIYDPVDIKVLRTKKYFLEHYYLRPKKQQVQFLCELEVVGRPQNAISERNYDYKNWENIIPGSIEFSIYHGVISNIGTSMASKRGHMTFVDMLDEYTRIALN